MVTVIFKSTSIDNQMVAVKSLAFLDDLYDLKSWFNGKNNKCSTTKRN